VGGVGVGGPGVGEKTGGERSGFCLTVWAGRGSIGL